MGNTFRDLSSIEIRSLMLNTLAYEGSDIDSEGNNFKKYDYQGTQSDLFRLLENLAMKNGMVSKDVTINISAWGVPAFKLHSGSTTNFSSKNIKNIYEQFHVLLNQGVIAPGANQYYGCNLPSFHVTEYGMECLKNREILPYDIDGYLKKVRSILGITEWVEFYITEALKCYNSNCMEAAVIMLGLASEKIILEQTDALLNFLHEHDDEKHLKMETEINGAKFASQKYTIYIKYFKEIKNGEAKNDISGEFKKISPLMDNLAMEVYYNFTRITRNALSHPNETKMEKIDVLMIFISFIRYCEIQYAFINYFKN